MAFGKDYAVPALIGAVISIFMDEIVVRYIKVALTSERMRKSLEKKVDTLKGFEPIFLHIREKCDTSVIDEWQRRCNELKVRASTIAVEHTGFSRVNIFSRHRRSKDIANLISDMDEYLKLLPVFLLECSLSLILKKRRLSPSSGITLALRVNDVAAAMLGWGTTAGGLKIYSFIGRLRNFRKELTSLTELMNKIDPFVGNCQRMLELLDANYNWLNDARNWVGCMGDIIAEGRGISDTGSLIARYKRSGQITGSTSRIDAHLDKLSSITLALLFHEIEGPTGRPLTNGSQETEGSWNHLTGPQETEGSWNHLTGPQETEGSWNHLTGPQETEGWTRDAVPSYETEGSTSHLTAPQETEGSRSHPTAPQETEGSRSHPTPSLQDVSITVTETSDIVALKSDSQSEKESSHSITV